MGDDFIKKHGKGLQRRDERGIDRSDFLQEDRERFKGTLGEEVDVGLDRKVYSPGEVPDIGPASVLMQHNPYMPQENPNPSGRATTVVTLRSEVEKDLPQGTRVLSFDDGVMPFELMENIHIDEGQDRVTQVIACDAGAQGNIDIHQLQYVEGASTVEVSQPFPGSGGADITPDGTVVEGGEPPKPNLEQLAENASPDRMGDQEALRVVRDFLDHGLRYQVPREVFASLEAAVHEGAIDPPVHLVNYGRIGVTEVAVFSVEGGRTVAFTSRARRPVQVDLDGDAIDAARALTKGGQ